MNVANALNAEFTPEEQREIEQPQTTSAAAYALYLQYLNLIGTGNQGPQAIALLDRMIADDPEFAAPYGSKAFIYANSLINTTIGSAGDTAAVEAQARQNAERALELDPKNAGAHSALANIELYNWRWPEARAVYERFRRETGASAAYHHWFESWTGQYQEAIEIAERSATLNPLIWSAHWNLGIVLTYDGQYDRAVEAFRKGIDLAPTLPLQHSWLAMAEIARGNTADALSELQLAEQLLGNNRAVISLVDLIYGYGRIGRLEDAQRLFDEVESMAEQQDPGAGGWALAYLGIGDDARALEWLQVGADKAADKQLDSGFFSLMNLRVNFTADPRLEQAQFVELRNRLSGN
jgi:tetratricopeptide (TPR) repeat protein